MGKSKKGAFRLGNMGKARRENISNRAKERGNMKNPQIGLKIVVRRVFDYPSFPC